MSQIRTEIVACPECGNRQNFTVWDSVSSDDEELVRDLLSGKLFEFRCRKCGCISDVYYPMLYSDMDHRRFIWMVSPDEKARREREIRDFALPGVRQKIVTTPEELAEAIRTVNIADNYV